ncbi:MAG: drug/metabolite transporter (DMT)-like permease [Candidatus Azotimanducaceae bacterium]
MEIEPWVWWTLLAAMMQAVRTAGQKQLTSHVTPLAATLVRYLYGLPFALLWLAYAGSTLDFDFPALNPTFLVSGFIAGILQIIATLLLVRLLTLRNFAVGTTFVKSEILLTAVIGYFFFTETVTAIGWSAIAICIAGLLTISYSKTGRLASFWNQSAVYGLGAGLSFALTSLFLRQASLSLAVDDPMLTAGMTLAYMVCLQTVITLFLVRTQQPGEITKVVQNWKPALFIGFTGVLGSIGWFTAMTLEIASYVKTLGQLEFVFTLALAVFYFKESPSRIELVGMILVVLGGIVLLLD